MSRMNREIAQHMSVLCEPGENRVAATFLFPTDFIGFQGHFPGEPILPGVCEIQAVLVMLSSWKSKNIRLGAVRLAKFLAPIGGNEEIEVTCEVTREDSRSLAVKAIVSVAGTQKALLWIEASIEG